MVKLRGTRAEAKSLLFLTINLNNITFPLTARGSEEKMTTARRESITVNVSKTSKTRGNCSWTSYEEHEMYTHSHSPQPHANT